MFIRKLFCVVNRWPLELSLSAKLELSDSVPDGAVKRTNNTGLMQLLEIDLPLFEEFPVQGPYCKIQNMHYNIRYI